VFRLHEIGYHNTFLVAYDGSQRNGQHQIVTLFARSQITLAVGTGPGRVVRVPLVGKERGRGRVGPQDHGSAFAPGAAYGSPLRPAAQSLEADHTGATVSSAQVYADAIDEHETAVCSLLGEHVYQASAAAMAVLHHAAGHGEQGVVATLSDVVSRVDTGSALANNDGSGIDQLTVKDFRSEALRS
jgi:hypothetical protein